MPKPAIDRKTLGKNKAVNQQLLEQAERYKRELAKLGYRRPHGYRLSHPLDNRLVRLAESGRALETEQI